jgi:hypothetical protein
MFEAAINAAQSVHCEVQWNGYRKIPITVPLHLRPQGLASSNVSPDEAAQRRFVAIINGHLRNCGAELREGGTDAVIQLQRRLDPCRSLRSPKESDFCFARQSVPVPPPDPNAT